MNRILTAAVTILATLAGLALLWQLRLAIVLFLLSLVVAAMLRPAIQYWVRQGYRRGVAIGLTYFIGLVLLGSMVYLVTGPALLEMQQATDDFAVSYENMTQTWPAGTPFQQAVAAQLPPPQRLYSAIAGEQGTLLIQNVLGLAQGVFLILGQFFIVLVLSIYWTVDQVRFERLWLSVLAPERRTQARAIWRAVESGVGAYLRSEFLQSLLAGLVLGIGYSLMELRYPVLLAVTSALLWLIPWVGALLAVVMPLLVGLVQGPIVASSAATYTLIVLMVLEVVVEPRLFNRRRYSSLLVVIFVVALVDAFGLIGLIMGPPLAAATQITFDNLLRKSAPGETVNPQVQIGNLQTRLEKVQAQVAAQEGEPPPEVVNLVKRLDELVHEAGEVLKKEVEGEEPTLGLPGSPSGA